MQGSKVMRCAPQGVPSMNLPNLLNLPNLP
jgi:hypothetical protein